MSNFTNENFRQILDSGDVLANSLSSVLVEKLSSELSRVDLVNMVNVVQQVVKKRHDSLISEIHQNQQRASKIKNKASAAVSKSKKA